MANKKRRKISKKERRIKEEKIKILKVRKENIDYLKIQNNPDFYDLTWLFGYGISNFGIIVMDFNETSLLWKCVKKTKGNVLEIGRKRGGSTLIISSAILGQGRKIISLDKEDQVDKTVLNILTSVPYSNFVDLRICDSQVPLKEDYNFDLFFVDGDHSYKGVKLDIISHWKNLEKGGLVLFHDAVPVEGIKCFEGVGKLCNELVKLGIMKEISRELTLIVAEKIKELPNNFGEEL